MQVLWKSGFKKVLKIGKQTWLTKKKESKVDENAEAAMRRRQQIKTTISNKY